MKLTACVLASALLTFSAAASAQEAPPAEAHAEFGQAGVLAFEAATGLNLSSTSHQAAQGDDPDSTLNVRVEPSLHYFVVENVSVGALLAFELTKQGHDEEREISAGPLVGYNLPLGEKLSLWPQVGGAYVAVSEKVGAEEGSGHKLQVLVNAPLLVHLAPHFHFGIGPYAAIDVSSKLEGEDADKDTTLGLAGTIGGWL